MRNIFERTHGIYMINEIRDKLDDEISKYLFDARVRYLIYRDEIDFCETINSRHEYDADKIPYIGLAIRQFPTLKNLVVYGAGHNGIITMSMLKNSNVSLKLYFCDSDRSKQGKSIYDAKVLSFSELIQMKNDSIIVIAVKNASDEIYNLLISNGVPKHQIINPEDNLPIIYFNDQYFDFFSPNANEVFVDGGSYDGMSACEFVKWAKNGFDGIYIYEANPNNEIMIRKNLADNDVEGYTLLGCGLWSHGTELSFHEENGRGASIDGCGLGNTVIKVNSIDNTINERVSFIKMDIEGSEYEAILGAEKTIKKYSPRLAISIYHKPEDIFEIPALILSLNKNYKFAIRHYSSGFFETILYAWIPAHDDKL